MKNKKMTTDFVRVIKAKSKILYELSTSQGEELSEKHK